MKLEAVRRYRAQVEGVLRMELLRASQELQAAETTRHAFEAQARTTAERYFAEVGAGMAVEKFLEWQVTFETEASMLAHVRQVESRLHDEWSQKQNSLREAMQERRTLDRLAERMRLQRRAAHHRVEQMQMDEAARRTSALSGPQNSL